MDRGKYFVINRGRQYGKTTTLMVLAEYLKDDYMLCEGLSDDEFRQFCR